MNYTYVPKKVSVADLLSSNEKRVQERENVKNLFLEKCHVRIATYNNFGREDVIFEIPPFVIGVPPYVSETVQKYLVDSLTEDGFFASPIQNSNSIYISWKKKDVEKIKRARNGFIVLDKNGFFDNLPINPNAVPKQQQQQQQSQQQQSQQSQSQSQHQKNKYRY